MTTKTEKFIANAKLIHGDNYGYDKANYVNLQKDIIITCKCHGYFLQKPLHHLRGRGCPKDAVLKTELIYDEKNKIDVWRQL